MKHLIVVVFILISGCATGLNSIQKQELISYEAKGLLVEEKNVSVAAALGIFPGGGSFYTRNYAPGVLNLLLWPFSVLWDPISGNNGAETINYHATVARCSQLKSAELADLEAQFESIDFSSRQYAVKRRAIENKYSAIENNRPIIVAREVKSASEIIPAREMLKKLTKLQAMFDEALITEEEYKLKKLELLSKI